MDKARDTRWICSRTLFAALVIQALTPDALDLTLLANHRPPGPVFAIMSMLIEEREVEGSYDLRPMTTPSLVHPSRNHPRGNAPRPLLPTT